MANLAVSSDLLHNSWAAILKLYRETNPSDPHLSIKYRVYDQQPLNGTIIAFVSSPPCTSQQHLQAEGIDLISSSTLRENFPFLDFVSTKVNRVAVTLFASLLDDLSFLKDHVPLSLWTIFLFVFGILPDQIIWHEILCP